MRKILAGLALLVAVGAPSLGFLIDPVMAHAAMRAVAGAASSAVAAITSGTINGATVGATTPAAGTFTTLASTGAFSPSSTNGIVGTIAADNANTGSVGEFVTATVATPGSAVTSTISLNVTSISLTRGDWDVSAVVDYAMTGATATEFKSGISASTGTLPTQAGGAGIGTDPLIVVPFFTTLLSDTYSLVIPAVRVQLASTTTIFLVANSTFSAGSETVFGTIRARRVR